MTNLNQKLTEAIHALIPEAGLACSRCGGDGYNVEEDVFNDYFQVECNHCEASGLLEPELRHVLWALSMQQLDVSCESDSSGTIIDVAFQDRTVDHIAYHLTKTLYQQSDETKQWLLNLLANPKGDN